jgi:predicted DNA-binding transcriptional regulator
MNKIDEILKNFSFSQPESKIYLAALKLKKATVSEIAQKAGMGRTVAYFHIKNLLKRNLLKQFKSGKILHFSPIPPAELAQRLDEEVGILKSLVPHLESLNTAEKEIPEIEIQESNIAFQKIYDEVTHMPAGSSWKVIEDQKGAEAELKLLDNKFWNQFFTQMAERQITTQAIFTKELLAEINKSITPKNYEILKKRRWHIHTIEEAKLPIKNLVVLYNNKLSFMFPEISLTITIKHPMLFHVVNVMFDTIFALTEPAQNPWDFKK